MCVDHVIKNLVWIFVLIIMGAIAEECWIATICNDQLSWTRLPRNWETNWENGISECQQQIVEISERLQTLKKEYSALEKRIDNMEVKQAESTPSSSPVILVENNATVSDDIIATTNDVTTTSEAETTTQDSRFPYDCSGNGENVTIYPWKNEGDLQSVDVNCDLYSVTEDGWITIQKRFNNNVRFHDRNWENYTRGFGNKSGEFWLGLRTIHQLTTAKNYKLRIDLDFQVGWKGYAEYSIFKVGSEKEKFRLTISGYSGDVGDDMAFYNGQYFSTVDVDNGIYHANCAQLSIGAWWWYSCGEYILNGQYLYSFGWATSLITSSEMKIHLV